MQLFLILPELLVSLSVKWAASLGAGGEQLSSMRHAELRAVFVGAKRAAVPAIFLLGSTSTLIQCSLIYFCVRKEEEASA